MEIIGAIFPIIFGFALFVFGVALFIVSVRSMYSGLKTVPRPTGMNELLVEEFLEAHPEPPEDMILNVDATDDPLHGKQEGRSRHQRNGESHQQQRLPRTYGHCLPGLYEYAEREYPIPPVGRGAL